MKHIYTFLCLFLLSGVPSAYGETINYDNGDKYVGEVSYGDPHGHGTYTWAKGSKYVGEWKNGKRHGQGTFTYANGEKYVGEFKYGNGWNGIAYADDGTIKGKFIEGVMQSGEFACVKERYYIEDGKNMIDCEFYDGARYVGGYETGNRNSDGHGTYFYADGSKYVGEWKDNLRHGHCTFFYADGAKYVGEYKVDLKHGHGTYTWANGSKYVGEWKDGNYWIGIYYAADGTVLGTYSYGVWISK